MDATKTSPIVDELENRLVVTIRLELSQERAKRVYPDLLDPESDLSKRVAMIYRIWVTTDDERIASPDLPFILAREASR